MLRTRRKAGYYYWGYKIQLPVEAKTDDAKAGASWSVDCFEKLSRQTECNLLTNTYCFA